MRMITGSTVTNVATHQLILDFITSEYKKNEIPESDTAPIISNITHKLVKPANIPRNHENVTI